MRQRRNIKIFLKKLNEVKIGTRNFEQEKVIANIDKFYHSREEVINFFRDYIEMLSDVSYKAKQNGTTGTGLKILTPKQMLQGLSITQKFY